MSQGEPIIERTAEEIEEAKNFICHESIEHDKDEQAI